MKYPKDTLNHYLKLLEETPSGFLCFSNRDLAHELFLYAKKKHPGAKILYYKEDQVICLTEEALSRIRQERRGKKQSPM